MAGWPNDELRRIAEADDLHIAPFRGYRAMDERKAIKALLQP